MKLEPLTFCKLVKYNIKKQPSRSVLKKRCYGNMQQIYRRTPMSKCDFNKVAAKQHYLYLRFALKLYRCASYRKKHVQCSKNDSCYV